MAPTRPTDRRRSAPADAAADPLSVAIATRDPDPGVGGRDAALARRLDDGRRRLAVFARRCPRP
jgi:hypothetical protein